MAAGDTGTVFLETSLGTRLVVSFPARATTVADLKRQVSAEHAACFHSTGPIAVTSLQVKLDGSWFQLTDSMAVQAAFEWVKGPWRLLVEAHELRPHPLARKDAKCGTDDGEPNAGHPVIADCSSQYMLPPAEALGVGNHAPGNAISDSPQMENQQGEAQEGGGHASDQCGDGTTVPQESTDLDLASGGSDTPPMDQEDKSHEGAEHASGQLEDGVTMAQEHSDYGLAAGDSDTPWRDKSHEDVEHASGQLLEDGITMPQECSDSDLAAGNSDTLMNQQFNKASFIEKKQDKSHEGVETSTGLPFPPHTGTAHGIHCLPFPNSTPAVGMGDVVTPIMPELISGDLARFDPCHLPPCFFMKEEKRVLRTQSSGEWKENTKEFTAIRSGESSLSGMIRSPPYQGVRRTLRFCQKDGTKTPWKCLRERQPGPGPGLYLEENVVLRKVFNTKSPADPNGKSDDNIWRHFKKINTDDDAVVYAACHRCDSVLKAHPKKHGTSQLKRHSTRCSKHYLSTDVDREILDDLRRLSQDWERGVQEANVVNDDDLTELDPSELQDLLNSRTPRQLWYVATGSSSPIQGWKTHGGWWKEKAKDFTAIRTGELQMQGSWNEIDKEFNSMQIDQLQMKAPRYIGLRRTLEFHQRDGSHGTKTDWTMFEYQQLVDDFRKPPAMVIQGGMVIRKVQCCGKTEVSFFSELDNHLNTDNDEHFNGDEGVSMDIITASGDYLLHGGGDRKRKRTDDPNSKQDISMHFTMFDTKDGGVQYAVCHGCDRVCISSNLRRHYDN